MVAHMEAADSLPDRLKGNIHKTITPFIAIDIKILDSAFDGTKLFWVIFFQVYMIVAQCD